MRCGQREPGEAGAAIGARAESAPHPASSIARFLVTRAQRTRAGWSIQPNSRKFLRPSSIGSALSTPPSHLRSTSIAEEPHAHVAEELPRSRGDRDSGIVYNFFSGGLQ
eukprot:396520-Prymnesium_polylepis.1